MTDEPKLKPCPFCGAGETTYREQRLSPTMDGRTPALISATIRHWCEPVPGVVASYMEFRGRTREDAVAVWERRTNAFELHFPAGTGVGVAVDWTIIDAETGEEIAKGEL